MADDGVRERHGMTVRKRGHHDANAAGLFDVFENMEGVIIPSHVSDYVLTPAQARYLARKLYHLARRIEKRAEAVE